MSTARAVRRAYDLCFADLGVNLAEASILAHLGHSGPLTQIELARRIGHSRARIGVNIDSLQAKGAVERHADPSDRRVWIIDLTTSGRKLWTETVVVDRYVRKQLRIGTTSDDRLQLDSLLERIHKNVDGIVAPVSPE